MSSTDEPVDNIAPKEPEQPKMPEFFTEKIARYIIENLFKEREIPLKGINAVYPLQVTDGSVLTFTDSESGNLLAACRIRVTNKLEREQKTDELYLRVLFSDLTINAALLKK